MDLDLEVEVVVGDESASSSGSEVACLVGLGLWEVLVVVSSVDVSTWDSSSS